MPTAAALVLGTCALALAWFVILWLAVGYTIALVSGWKRLRLLYATGPFDGETSTFAGYVGGSRYRGRALIAGASQAGLYLNVVAPFRIGAGPVLVPWNDIEVSAPSSDSASLVTFDFPKARTRLRAPAEMANKLLAWQPHRAA